MAQVVTPQLGAVVPGAGQADWILPTDANLVGFSALNAGLANGDTINYFAYSPSKAEWEFGLGTYTAATRTLARTTVYRSSAGGTTKCTFSGGNVVVTISLDAPGNQTYVLSNIGGGGARTFDGTQGAAATISATVSRIVADLQAMGIFK